MMKNIKTLVFSTTSLLLLAACGTESTQQQETTTDTQEPTEQVGETETNQTEQTSETGETESEKNESEGTTESTNTGENSTQGIENREFEYTLEDAVQIFFDTFPEAEGIDHVEFDVDDGRFEYEMDGFNADMEFELTVDAETGEIRDQKSEADDDNETAINFENIISPQEAMAIALEDAGAGYVKEWELDMDDGRTEYDIDIEGADDREIDAETGEIVDR